MNTSKDHIYLIEQGMFLSKDDPEYEEYNMVYDKEWAYYDENQFYSDNPEQDVHKLKQEILDRSNYYIIVTDQGHINDFGDTFITDKPEDVPVENTSYDPENIVYYEGKYNNMPIFIKKCKIENSSIDINCELQKLCKKAAIQKIFCNVDEPEFPENIEEFLANGQLYDEKTGKEAVIWEPYENKSCDEIFEILETEKESAMNLIQEALKIINKKTY